MGRSNDIMGNVALESMGLRHWDLLEEDKMYGSLQATFIGERSKNGWKMDVALEIELERTISCSSDGPFYVNPEVQMET